MAEIYWKMLRLSAAISQAQTRRPGDQAVLAAREALWRGQANDAYWHGVFGGCYLPHLRRAVKTALLEAEARLASGGAPLEVTVADVNGDGQDEIVVRTSDLSVTLNPARGGTLTEIGALGRRHDAADVLARRPETYHARLASGAEGQGATRSIGDTTPEKEPGLHRLLAYDRFRRASLLDGLFASGGDLDAVEPWAACRLSLGDAVFEHAVERRRDGVEIVLRLRGDHPELATVEKRVTVAGATVSARYRLTAPAGSEPRRTMGRQWNLALSAGDAPGRYLTRPDRPSLGSAGHAGDATDVALVDEWLGLQVHLAWRGPGGHAIRGTSGDRVGVRRRFRAAVPGDRAAGELAAIRYDSGDIDDPDHGGAMMLDDPRAIERVDRHDTRRVLTEFPAHCRRAQALQPMPLPAAVRPRLVVVAGMGGSAAGGDLVAACASDTLDVPLLVHRGYGLPAAAGPESLVVALSYSGDTAEVLSAVEVALRRGIPVVAVTAGGALGALAQTHGFPRVTLPAGLMPRMALGYLAFPLLTVLAACGVPAASATDIEDALSVVQDQGEDLGPERPSEKNEAKRLALAIGTRLPVIYGGPLTGAVAYRWKTDLEENAKVLAIAGAVPR